MTITPYQAKQELRQETAKWIAEGERIFGFTMPQIELDFSLRGQTAGQAWTTRNKIRYNLGALKIEGGWDHLFGSTVPHEVAHMIQYLNPAWPKDRRSNSSHGIYWKRVMAAFGKPANRCHSLPLPKARIVTSGFMYRCGCQTHSFTKVRHNKVRRGTEYSCRKCNTKLSYVGSKSIV